jgi:hypothetical protein
VVKCEAAVAEKGADETSGEKFEYQAEVCFSPSFHSCSEDKSNVFCFRVTGFVEYK